MIVYRFCNRQYKNDLSGDGSRLFGGRWNSIGLPALYTSSSISLGLLEVLVNAKSLSSLQQLSLMRINVPDNLSSSVYRVNSLKPHWHHDFDYSQYIGSEFLRKADFLLFECPSAVVFNEKNFMLNPLHKDYNNLSIADENNFAFDERLFKQG